MIRTTKKPSFEKRNFYLDCCRLKRIITRALRCEEYCSDVKDMILRKEIKQLLYNLMNDYPEHELFDNEKRIYLKKEVNRLFDDDSYWRLNLKHFSLLLPEIDNIREFMLCNTIGKRLFNLYR